MVAEPGFCWVQQQRIPWCQGRELFTLLVTEKAWDLDEKGVSQIPNRPWCRLRDPETLQMGALAREPSVKCVDPGTGPSGE